MVLEEEKWLSRVPPEALLGASGMIFGGLWDHSLSFPVAFSISDGHFFIPNSIYSNLH